MGAILGLKAKKGLVVCVIGAKWYLRYVEGNSNRWKKGKANENFDQKKRRNIKVYEL